MEESGGMASHLYRISTPRYFVSDSPRISRPLLRRVWEEGGKNTAQGCRSAMYRHALPKDYDYFIALYARVVKFACHFNNWLPADAGLYRALDRVWTNADGF